MITVVSDYHMTTGYLCSILNGHLMHGRVPPMSSGITIIYPTLLYVYTEHRPPATNYHVLRKPADFATVHQEAVRN